jgi:DNA-binding IscR family transcriptional regulator
MTLHLPSRRAYVQRAVLAQLAKYGAGQFVGATTIAADLACERSPAAVAAAINSMRGWVESRKGRGGGYRLSHAGRAQLLRSVEAIAA